MKKGIGKTISVIAILTMTFQLGMPIIPVSQTEVLATNETTVEQQSADEQTEVTEEISRNYEIKEEETWDISANGDGSVVAKWTLNDRTLIISGTGEMKNWTYWSKELAFNNITNIIENVTILEGVTNIGDYAFYDCSNLKDISIPKGVTSIGESAFYRCSNLTDINIPEGVTTIRTNAFYQCSSLKNVNIPQSVTSIEDEVFEECCSLENINVEKDNSNYASENGILLNKEKTEIIRYPEGKKDINQYDIPNSIKSIGSNAFYGCTSLENINIPNSVTWIGYRAFGECISLTNITIPESVTSIGNRGSNVFLECASLENINVNINNKNYMSENGILFNKNKTEIIKYPEGRSDVTTFEVPSSVTVIRESAFEGCTSLESIKIPQSVTWIESSAFDGCSNLKSIEIPENVTNMGSSLFSGCNSLIIYVRADSEAHKYAEENQLAYILNGEAIETSLDYEISEEETWDISTSGDESVIAKWTLQDRTITISGRGEMKDWDYDSKENWNNTQYTNIIENVIILDGVEGIGEYAFHGCSSLTGVNIPVGVKRIGYRAFDGCSSLENINIPNGVTRIENNTFYGCRTLKNIDIPKSVTKIGSYVFGDCDSLEDVNVEENNENYISEDGILFNKEKTEIIRYPEGKKDINQYDIPDSVKSIGAHAFDGCSSLESIIIPESVTSIGYWAFNECTSLTEIVIPEEVVSIEREAIPESIIIYTKKNTEGHRYAEESGQGYILLYDIGDIDENERIDITDLLMLKRYLVVGSKVEWKLSWKSLLAADMNEDGNVDVTDMLMLKRIIVEDM